MELIFLISSIVITLLASIILKIVYSIYKNAEIESNYTGLDVANEILKNNDLDDIEIETVYGELSDCYNNSKKVIKLSNGTYSNSSIASVAVAAHECGHAIQYKVGYFPIKIRNFLVPIVNIGSNLGYIVICIGVAASISKLFLIGIALISFAVIFQFITLPVEINASKRGKKELLKLGIINENEISGVTLMLAAAAFTYLAGLLSSILQILRLIYIFTNSNDE